MPGASLKIVFENEIRAFNADHPIIGSIDIDAPEEIGAYGI